MLSAPNGLVFDILGVTSVAADAEDGVGDGGCAGLSDNENELFLDEDVAIGMPFCDTIFDDILCIQSSE